MFLCSRLISPKMFYSMDSRFLASLGVEINIAMCFRCGEYGHQDNNCETEVVFEDMSGNQVFYN